MPSKSGERGKDQELEEKLQQVKIDEGSLQIFKESTEKVRTKLEEAIIDMYSHLHMFQEISATIIDQQSRVKAKNTQMNTIQEGIDDIDRWIAENLDVQSNSLTLQAWREK
jgi:hypothetical protein